MFSFAELHAGIPEREQICSFGLVDVDHHTGGLCHGDSVILTSAPRGGRTTLALQVARLAATEGTNVLFVTGRDDVREVCTRVMCANERMSRWDLQEAHPPARFWAGKLHIETDAPASAPAARSHLAAGGVVVVEDADALPQGWFDDLLLPRGWRATDSRGCLVLVLPRYVLGNLGTRTWQRWVRIADVVVEVSGFESDEPTLSLLSNRRGACFSMRVDPQLFRGRIEAV